ncbi:MAG: hypothetical protein LBT40_15650 [Deltaproteobacteria bacterium]|jgi:hypothetical protein|nr:hypothetical protein [Deltaproteobacteria bacterium]
MRRLAAPGIPAPLLVLAALAASASLALPTPRLAAQGLDPGMFEGQSPVTEADVPAAIAAIGEITKDEPDPARIEAIASEHGTTPERMAYLAVKFLTGVAMLAPDGPSREEIVEKSGTDKIIPNPEELEVIRGAFDRIVAAVN